MQGSNASIHKSPNIHKLLIHSRFIELNKLYHYLYKHGRINTAKYLIKFNLLMN